MHTPRYETSLINVFDVLKTCSLTKKDVPYALQTQVFIVVVAVTLQSHTREKAQKD